MRNAARLFAVTAALAAVTPSTLLAQKLGQGGTGVDETTVTDGRSRSSLTRRIAQPMLYTVLMGLKQPG